MTPPRFRPMAVILLSVLLGACSAAGTPFEGMFGEPPPPLACPEVRVLREAVNVTHFRDGPGRDLTDVTAEAAIADFIARCLYDVDDETGVGEIIVEMSVGITAARGPANAAGRATFPYFVSITNLERRVINKSVFDMTVDFTGNAFRLTAYDEPVLLTIPIEPPQAGDQFIVFVGLQLTPEELEYNKARGAYLLGS